MEHNETKEGFERDIEKICVLGSLLSVIDCEFLYFSFSAAINSREILTQRDKDNIYTVELKDLRKSIEAGEYDPHKHREAEHATTNIETLLHLLKGSLGTGILAMPLAFAHSGYILGTIATILIGCLCTYCIHMLINCEYELCKRRNVPRMTYPTTAECAFQDGPPFFQRIAPYTPQFGFKKGTSTSKAVLELVDFITEGFENKESTLGIFIDLSKAFHCIMPLENEMKTPKSFLGICGVLNSAMMVIVSLYTGLGLYGYLAYGSDVGGSISFAIGNDIPAQVCKVMLSLAIYTSHPLQMYPAICIAWKEYLQPLFEKNPHQIYYEYAVRTFLVFITFCLAVAVPYIELFISLFGALSLSALGLAFPALIYISTHWDSLKGVRGTMIIVRNIVIFCFAIIGLVIGTSTSLEKIVEKFSGTNSTV
nr:proton-coupled amino acid transporter-like protein CG1139 [Leptinotarsa decemlineata]